MTTLGGGIDRSPAAGMRSAAASQEMGCFCCGVPADRSPCPVCAARMAEGVILIEVDEGRSLDPRPPFRTGNFAVVAEEGIRRCLDSPELVAGVLAARCAFVPRQAWKALGLEGCESR